MPEVPVGYGELSFQWSLSGDPEQMVCTLGFHPLAPDPDTLDLINSATRVEAQFREWFDFDVANQFFAGWTYHGADYRVRPDAGEERTGHVGSSITGTAVGETPPVNVAILIQKRSLLGGRKHRGRMYLPPARTAETVVSKLGVIDSASLTSLQNAANAFITDLDADALDEVVILHSDELLVPTPISSLQVSPLVATQRRRLRR